MLAGDVLTLDPTATYAAAMWAKVAAVVRPRVSGGYVVAAERELLLADSDDLDAPLRSLGEAWTDPGIRMNEGGCDPDGRFYIGTMAYDESPGGGTFYVAGLGGERAGGPARGDDLQRLRVQPGRALAYYTDTATGRVDVFDYDPEGGLSGGARSQYRPRGRGAGRADSRRRWRSVGGAVGGRAVHRYDAAAASTPIVELPVGMSPRSPSQARTWTGCSSPPRRADVDRAGNRRRGPLRRRPRRARPPGPADNPLTGCSISLAHNDEAARPEPDRAGRRTSMPLPSVRGGGDNSGRGRRDGQSRGPGESARRGFGCGATVSKLVTWPPVGGAH